MNWLLLCVLSCVAAQPSLPLLPDGVTIDMVKQIQVSTGGTVQFMQSTDGSSTISNRLATPNIKFDSNTGILSVTVGQLSGSSMLKPGLMVAFLAAIVAVFNSNNKQSAFVLCLFVGLGVASAASPDIIIRVPGCFHTTNQGRTLQFDSECASANLTTFKAVALPQGPGAPVTKGQWTPITPATSFLPVNDHGQHYLDPDTQYEVWRTNFGRAADPTEKQNFLAFTAACRIQNKNPNRTWTAACNQFAHLTYADWKSQVLASNAEKLAEANAGRRLLTADLYSDLSDSHSRKLLQTASFTWVDSGKLTGIKDQGQCGSCYAHSSSSQMEAQLAISQGSVPRLLSREQLKDCSSGSPGCEGGSVYQMFAYAAGGQGLGTESEYPYTPNDASCKSASKAFSDTGSVAISNTEAAFKIAVQNAPVAVTVCADAWNNYQGGVFTSCGDGRSCNVDHAVLLVGFGTDATLGDYWLIQNSWNTWWGEQGYIRIPRTDSGSTNTGACGLTRYAGYQAKSPSGIGGTGGGGTDCQGSWSGWSDCSATCGGGTQSQSWTTTTAASGNGAACPNPTTQTQNCNTNLCPSNGGGGGGGGGGVVTGSCLGVHNSVLGPTGDGNYNQAADWNNNWCGGTNPQYLNADGSMSLFFFATNCWNNVRTSGVWGLGPTFVPGVAYQWSDQVNIDNGVIPSPADATGWTIQFYGC